MITVPLPGPTLPSGKVSRTTAMAARPVSMISSRLNCSEVHLLLIKPMATSSAITITNIQIEEGEWVTGYKNNRGLPSGAIIIWDQNSSCPPGFSQVTSLNDRFPVGADNNAVQAKSTVTMASSGSLSTTLSIPPLTVTDADGATLYTSGGTISGSDTAEIPNAPHGHNGAIQTAASSVSASLALPFYGVLFCRAL